MNTNQAFTAINNTRSPLAPSPFALELAAHCYNQNASLESCSHIIAGNSQFTADLLRYANSSLYEGTMPTTSVTQVLTTVGRESVANLAIIFSLIGQYRHGKCPHFDYQRFWQKSLARGAAARALAVLHHSDPQQFFTYGVLSAIGDLALATAFPEYYDNLLIKNIHPDKTEIQRKAAIWSLDSRSHL